MPLAARREPQSSRSRERGRARAPASSVAAATGSGGMPIARARSLPVPAGRRATRGPSPPRGRPLATSWTVPSPPNTSSTSTSGASSAARASASPGSPAGYTGTRPNWPRSSRRASGRRSQAAEPTWATQAVGISRAPYIGPPRFTGGRGGGNNPARRPRRGGVGAGRDRGRGAAEPGVRGAHRRAAPARDPGRLPPGPAAVRGRERQRPAGQPRARAPELPAGRADPAGGGQGAGPGAVGRGQHGDRGRRVAAAVADQQQVADDPPDHLPAERVGDQADLD